MAGGTDEWFARTRSGLTQHFIADAIGSTIRLTDAAGVKVVDYTYDPYGGTSNDNASSTNVLEYAGRENDGLGLYYNRARYLKAKWGRFISQDPIGLNGEKDLYTYVDGNPDSYIDPEGNVLTLPGIIVVVGITYGGYKLYTKFEKFYRDVEDCKRKCESTVACGDPDRTGLYRDNAARCIATCKAKATIGSFFGLGKWPTGPKSPETTPNYFQSAPPAYGLP